MGGALHDNRETAGRGPVLSEPFDPAEVCRLGSIWFRRTFEFWAEDLAL